MTMGTRAGKGNKDGQGERGRVGPPVPKCPSPAPGVPKPPIPWCRCGVGGVSVRRRGAPGGGGEQGAGSGGAACWGAWRRWRSAALSALKEASHNIHYVKCAIAQGNQAYIYTCTREAGGGREALGHCAGVPLRRGTIAPLRGGAIAQGGAREVLRREVAP